jgi:cell wall-associated NlpC family hydrolase
VARRPHTAAEALARLRALKEQYEQVTKKYYEARILLGRRRAEAAVQAQRPAAAMVAAAVRLEHELAAPKAGVARLAAESRALYQRLSTSERQALLRARAVAAARAAASLRAGRSNRPAGPAPVDVPASGRGAIAVQWAKKQLGKPYVWAADGPDIFD